MKLLAATDSGWSPATDPENHVLPGELLLPAEQCDRPHCMCRREFVGVTTHARTMHALVVDRDVTDDQLLDIARSYVTDIWPQWDDSERDEEANDYVDDLTGPPAGWPAGIVLERWGYELRDIRDNNLGDDDAAG